MAVGIAFAGGAFVGLMGGFVLACLMQVHHTEDSQDE